MERHRRGAIIGASVVTPFVQRPPGQTFRNLSNGDPVLGNHQVQEFTVARVRRTRINDVICVVAGQFTQQRPRHTLGGRIAA
jgi:hypothetical protein